MSNNDIPPVSSRQFVKVLLMFEFVERARTRTHIELSKKKLNRRIIIRLDKAKLSPTIVKKTLAMAGISNERFVEALKKGGKK